MRTGLFTHPDCLRHDTGPGHPESIQRLSAILAALDGPGFTALDRRPAPLATGAQLLGVHTAAHIDAVLNAIPAQGHAAIEADTIVSPGSGGAALVAAGAVCAAIDAVMAGQIDNAFCAVRPPGHHAEPDRPMGFCLFNNIAVGAIHARSQHGLSRVAIVDFDVHHGNGTQSVAETDACLFYASTHQWPLYPGTGHANEQGRYNNILNVPLPPMAGGDAFRTAFQDSILPALNRFRPQLLLISAGFDAHRRDPLAALRLDETDFAWATAQLMQIADHHAAGRLVSALEGGYDLTALAASVAAHVRTLMTGKAE